MTSQVILYDLPSQQGTSWSLNPWKSKQYNTLPSVVLMTTARMILNYKDIDYKTEWIEYPDLAPTFKSLYVDFIQHQTHD